MGSFVKRMPASECKQEIGACRCARVNTRVKAKTPARRGGEQNGWIQRWALGRGIESGSFIFPHCESPFVNDTVYISKQPLRHAEWGKSERKQMKDITLCAAISVLLPSLGV